MPKGRPRTYLEEAERLQVRRAKVKLNVQAFRRRERAKEKERVAREEAAGLARAVISYPNGPSDRPLVRACRALVATFDMPFQELHPRAIAQPTRFEFLGDLMDKTAYQNVDSLWRKFPLGKSLDPISQIDFITGALQRRYIPDRPVPAALSYSPSVRIAQACLSWITTGEISNTPEASILRSALLASALGVIGLETHDTRLMASGLQVQTLAFQRMRTVLDSLAAGDGHFDVDMLAITILFCASSELTIHKSWSNFWKHMQGVGALVECGGPSGLSSPAARDMFYGYRALQTPFCFTQRRAHFLAERRWIDLAWRTNNPQANDHMQTMLDIAYQVPVEMQDYDDSHPHTPEDLRARITRLRGLAVQLDQWNADMDTSCTSTPPYRTQPAKWPGVFTQMIVFDDLTAAMPFNSACGVRVHLFDLIRQIAEELSTHDECRDSAQLIVRAAMAECLKWARRACQCMEFFQVQKSKFKIVGRLISLFPFDAAWDTFARFERDYGVELEEETVKSKTSPIALRVFVNATPSDPIHAADIVNVNSAEFSRTVEFLLGQTLDPLDVNFPWSIWTRAKLPTLFPGVRRFGKVGRRDCHRMEGSGLPQQDTHIEAR